MQISPVSIYNFNILSPNLQKNTDINFGRIGIDGSRMQRYFAHFPCPCCGLKRMLTYDDIKELTDMPENTPAKKMLALLAKYQQSMHPVERNIFNMLKGIANSYPNYNLRDLLETQREVHLKLLKNEELDILDSLNKMMRAIPVRYANRIYPILSEAKSTLKAKNAATPFKRKIFVGRIKHIAKDIPNKDIAKLIIGTAEKMPKASTSISAFVVKHTQKNPSTGKERTSKGIIYALLSPSLGTIEHIKVRSPHIKEGGGKDEMSNYLLECARDNNERNSMPFYEFVRLHPDYYGRHLQKYMDKFIRKFNHHHMKGFENYPSDVRETLIKESKGLVDVDISKLDIPRLDISNA